MCCRQNEQASTERKIQSTTADLKRLNDVVRHGDKQQKLNVKRLTSEFSSIVEGYSKCQKVCVLIFQNGIVDMNMVFK